MKNKLPNLRLFITLALITGVIYPLFMCLIGLVVFPHEATGSFIKDANGRIIGSELIAQKTTSPKYFDPRPSAGDYATTPSGASNYGLTASELKKTVEERRQAFLEKNKLPAGTPVPSDMVFASGSGLDPHISPAAAELQVARVAAERGMNPDKIREEIKKNTIPGGILGETRVKVLSLNVALDTL